MRETLALTSQAHAPTIQKFEVFEKYNTGVLTEVQSGQSHNFAEQNQPEHLQDELQHSHSDIVQGPLEEVELRRVQEPSEQVAVDKELGDTQEVQSDKVPEETQDIQSFALQNEVQKHMLQGIEEISPQELQSSQN